MRILLVGAVVAAFVGASPPAAWQRAADRLTMPVFYPTETHGLKLVNVRPQKLNCGQIKEQLDAFYGGGLRSIRVTEGRPQYCGDIGDAPLLSHPKVGTAKADLYRYCEDTGCAKVKLGYLLLWHRSGDQLVLVTRGLTVKQILEVATSMRLVPG